MMMRHPKGVTRVLRIGMRWIVSMLLRRRLLVRGQALAAAMRLGLREAGVPILLDTPLLDLQTADGRVVGVVVGGAAGSRVLKARHGVVLACGGFEHNLAMRKTLPARADQHRVDGRGEGEHRRRHPRRRAGRRCPGVHGRRVVGPVRAADRRAVVLPRRAHPARRRS